MWFKNDGAYGKSNLKQAYQFMHYRRLGTAITARSCLPKSANSKLARLGTKATQRLSINIGTGANELPLRQPNDDGLCRAGTELPKH